MKIKAAEYIADFLVSHGVSDVFTVTGGGAMHLNDALGHKKDLNCIYNHHEQASAIAAESYARLSGKIAAVCVTSGPGGTNAITGVLGGWLDSIPMFILSGQVKTETTRGASEVPLRQLGDQEYNIIDSVSPMTKYAVMITDAKELKYHLEKAWFLALSGRKGPVWLDIPLDIQAAVVDTEEMRGFDKKSLEAKENPVYSNSVTDEILEKIRDSRRPVILAGDGIYFGGAYKDFLECIDALKIPVVTAWNADDLLAENNPYFAGRPGTVGTRGGNFVVQNADLLLVLGCRMNIRMISYNKLEFAKDAYKIMVDIDKNELYKPTIKIDMPIHADVKDVLSDLKLCTREDVGDHREWLSWCVSINKRYPACRKEFLEKESPLNPYAFIKKWSNSLSEGDVIVCGNGAACVQTFQAFEVKTGQRLYTNSGCAAMGYGFPAAVGAAVYRENKRTICIDGDGSFMMNLQELQTVVYNKLNLKIFILNNNGYHSIRQTQTNLFKPPLVGVCSDNGISFPSFEKIAYAFDIPYIKIDSLKGIDEKLKEVYETEGAVICEVFVDESQNFEPKLSSKVMPDGTMQSPPIDDMFPFLPEEEYKSIREEAQRI